MKSLKKILDGALVTIGIGAAVCIWGVAIYVGVRLSILETVRLWNAFWGIE